MAFALALQSVHDLPEGHGQTILTATTAIIILTVRLFLISFKIFKYNQNNNGYSVQDFTIVDFMVIQFYIFFFNFPYHQVLLIGGSTGIMLEALKVVGDGHNRTFDVNTEMLYILLKYITHFIK